MSSGRFLFGFSPSGSSCAGGGSEAACGVKRLALLGLGGRCLATGRFRRRKACASVIEAGKCRQASCFGCAFKWRCLRGWTGWITRGWGRARCERTRCLRLGLTFWTFSETLSLRKVRRRSSLALQSWLGWYFRPALLATSLAACSAALQSTVLSSTQVF